MFGGKGELYKCRGLWGLELVEQSGTDVSVAINFEVKTAKSIEVGMHGRVYGADGEGLVRRRNGQVPLTLCSTRTMFDHKTVVLGIYLMSNGT